MLAVSNTLATAAAAAAAPAAVAPELSKASTTTKRLLDKPRRPLSAYNLVSFVGISVVRVVWFAYGSS
jgi:hypothetical protein